MIPANGWFEWRPGADAKQPCYVTCAVGEPLAFTVVWKRWRREDENVESFAMITTAACPALTAVHDRQPAIIEPARFEQWLDRDSPPAELLDLVRSPSRGPFENRPIGGAVNSVRNNGPQILRPVTPSLV